MLKRHYETDLTDAAWELVKPLIPAAGHGGRPRTTDVRSVVNAIFYLLRTGCQWGVTPLLVKNCTLRDKRGAAAKCPSAGNARPYLLHGVFGINVTARPA